MINYSRLDALRVEAKNCSPDTIDNGTLSCAVLPINGNRTVAKLDFARINECPDILKANAIDLHRVSLRKLETCCAVISASSALAGSVSSIFLMIPVSYTHLTLPTNREV